MATKTHQFTKIINSKPIKTQENLETAKPKMKHLQWTEKKSKGRVTVTTDLLPILFNLLDIELNALQNDGCQVLSNDLMLTGDVVDLADQPHKAFCVGKPHGKKSNANSASEEKNHLLKHKSNDSTTEMTYSNSPQKIKYNN